MTGESEAAERAAAILEDEATLGELLYGDGSAGSAYHRTEPNGDNVVTTILPDGGHLVHRIGGVDWDLL